MSFDEIAGYIVMQAVCCTCEAYFAESEYICPFCVRQTVYIIAIKDLERWLNYGY